MRYEKPEMEVLKFGKDISTLDIVGASQEPDNSDASNGW